MEADELGMETEEGSVDSVQNVRRNIPLMLKGSRAGRKKPSSPRRRTKDPQPPPGEVKEKISIPLSDLLSELKYEPVEADLPVLRGPAEPTHKKQTLRWDHRVNLIGEKVTDPRIHCCELCDLPILIYGRMIPCKHVFCLQCATKCSKKCGRCQDPVTRIEQCGVGTVFVCTYEGPRHSWQGCRRTYLSHRDLQAHIEHRHLKTSKKRSAPSSSAGVVNPSQPALQQSAVANLSQIHTSVAIPDLSIPPPDFSAGAAFPSGPPPAVSISSQYPPPPTAPAASFSHPPPTATAPTTVSANNVNFAMGIPRSNNLISIPILDDGNQQQQLGGSGYPQQLPPQQQQQFFNPQPTPGGPDLSRPPPNFSGPPPSGSQGVNLSQPPPSFHPPGPFNSPPDGSPRHNWSGPPPGRGAPGNMRPPGRGPSGGHRSYYQ